MRVVLIIAGGAAAFWAYGAVRDGRLPPNGRLMAGLTALQIAGAVMAIGGLVVR